MHKSFLTLAVTALALLVGLAACQPEAGAGDEPTESADARPADAQEHGPVIDMHPHAHTLGDFPPEEPLTGLRAPASTEKLREQTLAALERHNVVLAVTSGSKADSYRQAAPDRIVKGAMPTTSQKT